MLLTWKYHTHLQILSLNHCILYVTLITHFYIKNQNCTFSFRVQFLKLIRKLSTSSINTPWRVEMIKYKVDLVTLGKTYQNSYSFKLIKIFIYIMRLSQPDQVCYRRWYSWIFHIIAPCSSKVCMCALFKFWSPFTALKDFQCGRLRNWFWIANVFFVLFEMPITRCVEEQLMRVFKFIALFIAWKLFSIE